MSYQSPGSGYGQQPEGSGQPYGQYPGYQPGAPGGQPYGQGGTGGQPYGQGGTGGQPYGQYGQPAPGQQGGWGQPGAGQPGYGQPGYGQPGYGQYGQGGYSQAGQPAQQQYGYGQQDYGQQSYGQTPPPARKAAGQGLPSYTAPALAGTIGVLGLVVMFCGFAPGYTLESMGSSLSIAIFDTAFVAPYALVSAAGILALLLLIPGVRQSIPVVAALAATGGLTTLLAFFGNDANDMFGASVSMGAGAIIQLVFAFVMTLLAIIWLLIDIGLIKTAGGNAQDSSHAGGTTSTENVPAGTVGTAAAGSYGYGSTSAASYDPSVYGQTAVADQGQSAASGQASGPHTTPSGATPSGESAPSYGAPPVSDETTAFNKPDNGLGNGPNSNP